MVNYHHLFQLTENKKLFKETRFLNLEFSKTSFQYCNSAPIITTPRGKNQPTYQYFITVKLGKIG